MPCGPDSTVEALNSTAVHLGSADLKSHSKWKFLVVVGFRAARTKTWLPWPSVCIMGTRRCSRWLDNPQMSRPGPQLHVRPVAQVSTFGTMALHEFIVHVCTGSGNLRYGFNRLSPPVAALVSVDLVASRLTGRRRHHVATPASPGSEFGAGRSVHIERVLSEFKNAI